MAVFVRGSLLLEVKSVAKQGASQRLYYDKDDGLRGLLPDDDELEVRYVTFFSYQCLRWS